MLQLLLLPYASRILSCIGVVVVLFVSLPRMTHPFFGLFVSSPSRLGLEDNSVGDEGSGQIGEVLKSYRLVCRPCFLEKIQCSIVV